MTGLSGLNELVEQYIAVEQNSELSERRRDLLKSRIVVSISDAMRGTWRKMIKRKNMQVADEDIQQHVRIAIVRSIENWKPEVASFSTFAHYQIMWEIGNYEHYAHPERRRIKVKYPLQFIELDRPMPNPDGDQVTSRVDFLQDENAEQDIEDYVERQQVLDYIERVLSVHIERRMAGMSRDSEGRFASEREIYTLCRDIDIFIQTKVASATHAQLSTIYDVTRERVRQIVANVENRLSPYLPERNGDEYEAPQEIFKDARHPLWNALISWYFHYSERDMRCIPGAPMMPYTEALAYFAPVTPLAEQAVTIVQDITTEVQVKGKSVQATSADGLLPIVLPKTRPVAKNEDAMITQITANESRDTRQMAMPFMGKRVALQNAA